MSFGAQALHYFQRPHEDVRRTPLDGAAAWRGAEMRGATTGSSTRRDAGRRDRRRRRRGARRGLSMGELRREDFPLPTPDAADRRLGRASCATAAASSSCAACRWRRWGDDDSALAYWGLGQHLGRPGAQNPAGELLGHVVDTGEDAANPFVRRYRTAGDIAYHCDLADVVGLLCLRTGAVAAAPAASSARCRSTTSCCGAVPTSSSASTSRSCSTPATSRARAACPGVPVPPCRYAGGRLRTFYHSDYFRSVERHPRRAALHRRRARAARPLRGDRQRRPSSTSTWSSSPATSSSSRTTPSCTRARRTRTTPSQPQAPPAAALAVAGVSIHHRGTQRRTEVLCVPLCPLW